MVTEEDYDPEWPRVIWNYPIILSVIALQYIWAFALIWDQAALSVTAINSIWPFHHHPEWEWALIIILLLAATTSFCGFFMRRRIYTLLSFIPQQFVMTMSSVGAVHSIWLGQFADGTIRSHAFLLADQSPTIFLTIFHTWAMVLIMIHSRDT